MADKKITQLTEVSTLPDEGLITAVDTTRSAGDQNVKISVGDAKTLFGGGTQNEEDIVGTAIENAAMTGTVNLDLDTFSYFKGELTSATTITVTNEPAFNTSFVKNLKINSTTTESITLPASWDVIGSYVADGSDNYFTIIFSNLTIAGANATCYINQV